MKSLASLVRKIHDSYPYFEIILEGIKANLELRKLERTY